MLRNTAASLAVAALIGGLVAGAAVLVFARATAPAAPEAPAPVEARLPAEFEARIAALETETQAAADAARAAAERPIPEIPEAAIAASAQAAEANERAIEDLSRMFEETRDSQRDAVAALDTRISALDSAFARLEIDPGSTTREAAVHLAAADHISAALAAGRPYADAHGALAAWGAPADRLAALAPFASAGAPTDAQLAADLEAALASAAAPDAPAGPAAPDLGGGLLQRLAERAITIEALEPSGAAAPAADFAPILAALRAGDHAGALEALPALPDATRQAAAASVAAIEARLAAEEAARMIAEEALAALAAGR
ncbi:MAG: hypothetical protein EA385_03195 [Salinarimonadaceae bacterium]|nr:MAG: hypothetical protein EA385_03195 [Salinarimonadaceae bacterium]